MLVARVVGAASLLLIIGALPVSATPAGCSGTCKVESFLGGYVPPVLEVTNASEVVWGSLDSSHSSWETPLVGTTSSCFRVAMTSNDDSRPVKFEIQGSHVVATVSSTTDQCDAATPLPDGSFLVPYYCPIHPSMRGFILVSP
jgi:hypothetical protein